MNNIYNNLDTDVEIDVEQDTDEVTEPTEPTEPTKSPAKKRPTNHLKLYPKKLQLKTVLSKRKKPKLKN